MENISENTKRQRGRPPKIPEWEWRIHRDGMYEHMSARHQNNIVYQTRALSHLMNDEGQRFVWLCSDEATVWRGETRLRLAILSELGRIDNEQEREALALHICQKRLKTREAVMLLRRYRLGRVPRGDATSLADVVRKTINAYLATHSLMLWDNVRQALYHVLADIDATEGTEECTRTAVPVV